jgi:hypothetical protein
MLAIFSETRSTDGRVRLYDLRMRMLKSFVVARTSTLLISTHGCVQFYLLEQ